MVISTISRYEWHYLRLTDVQGVAKVGIGISVEASDVPEEEIAQMQQLQQGP